MAELFDIMTHDTERVTNVTVGNTWQVVGELVTPNRVSGAYRTSFALVYTFDETNTSVFLRWTDDGGASWTEYSKENKDATDATPVYYAFPDTYPEAVHTITVQMKKETPAGTLKVNDLNISFLRVG